MTEKLSLDGQVALVTGSGRGLGRAHAMLLAAHGASVIVNDPGVSLEGDGNDRNPAQTVVEEIRAAGGQAEANFGDVSDESAAQAMVDQAIARFGSIDIVVNNAGNFFPRHPFTESSTETFEKIWRVHVLGSINCIRAAWPHMSARRYGRIINTASHTALLGSPRNIEYSAAKGALFGITNSLAFEAAENGIAINAIAPGALTRPVSNIKGVAENIPAGAFDPALASPIIIWLAHKDCPVNGETFGAMSGTTTRLKVVETEGYFSRTPTPEAVRSNFPQIMAEDLFEASQLIVSTQAETRGSELMSRFVGAANG